jgi:Cu/Ag efflux pump CusA
MARRGRAGAVLLAADHHAVFIPVFTLEAQEGRLFSPLAFTKTYAMAAAAGCRRR